MVQFSQNTSKREPAFGAATRYDFSADDAHPELDDTLLLCSSLANRLANPPPHLLRLLLSSPGARARSVCHRVHFGSRQTHREDHLQTEKGVRLRKVSAGVLGVLVTPRLSVTI